MHTPKILTLATLSVFMALTCVARAAQSAWIAKAPLPTARFGLTTSMVNGKIYAMGGSDAPYVPYFNTVEIYDPATDTWTSGTPMPNERMGHTAAVVNDKIYVMGGAYVAQTSTAYVDEYDPATDTWTAKAEMPTDRVFHCAGAVGGKIYVFGGCRYVNNVNVSNPPAVDVYDPTTDTWTTKGRMRSPRDSAAACVVNDMIYVFGGIVGDLANAPVGTADVYDPATDSWKAVARAASRACSGICRVEDKIYVMGSGSLQGCSSRVDIYDPATDTWQTGPKLNRAMYFMGANYIGGSIVVFGGSEVSWPWTGISTSEAYTPPPFLKISHSGTTVALSWTGTLQEVDGSIVAPWRDVTPSPTSPWTIDPNQGSVMKCFRSRAP